MATPTSAVHRRGVRRPLAWVMDQLLGKVEGKAVGKVVVGVVVRVVGALLLAGTFVAYLNPHLAVDLASRLWSCF